jgi:hypothetical protein
VGSLAAAYAFRTRLESRAVNTKDADVVVHPAGDLRSSAALARNLLRIGWSRTPECYPRPGPAPADELRAIRLYPPGSRDYFVELLGLPRKGQTGGVAWTPLPLPDGWYGIGCFRFMGLLALKRFRSDEGLDYASPAVTALAHLLAHPEVGPQRMSAPIQGRKILRSAKDLGRVLALAWLAGRDEAAQWLPDWEQGLRTCFPVDWRRLARGAGTGLRELLEDEPALEEARVTTEVGLLSGRGVTAEALRAVGRQLLADAIEPLERLSHRRQAVAANV